MLTPDDIAQRRFLVALRGFDRDEVTTFLREVADEVRRLRTRVAELEADVARRERAERQGTPDPKVALQSLGEETTRILVAAEESAREIETKAQGRAQAAIEKADREAREASERANRQAARTIAEAERRRDQVAAEIDALKRDRDQFVAGLRASVATIGGVVGGLDEPADDVEAVQTEDAAEAIETVEPLASEPATAPEPEAEPGPQPEPEAALEREAALDAQAEAETAPEPGPEPVVQTEEPATPKPPTVRSRRDGALQEGRGVMARQCKRALQDVQNEVLASIREHGRSADLDDLLPGDAELEALGDTGKDHLAATYAQAIRDAAAAVDEQTPEGLVDGARVQAAAATFRAVLAHEVTSALRATLRAGLEAEEPEPQLSERVGEIFRDLRGPVLEGVVDEHLSRTYAHGLLDAWEQLGVEKVRWEAGPESRCPENRCRTNAGEGAVALGEDFASGDRVPPAHPGCTCVVVPATA